MISSTAAITSAAAITLTPIAAMIAYAIAFDADSRKKIKQMNLPTPDIEQIFFFGQSRGEPFFFQMKTWHERLLSVYKMHTPVGPMILTTEPEDFKKVYLQANLDKGGANAEVRRYWGANNLVTLQHGGQHGHIWKTQRNLLDQGFKIPALRVLESTFVRHTERFVANLETLVDKEVNMTALFADFTFDIIADVIGAGEAPKEFKENMNFLIRKLENPLLLVPWGGYIMRYIIYRHANKVVDKFIFKAINDRKKLRATGADSLEHKTILDFLLEAEDDNGRKLTDTEIRDQLYVFFLAGFETSSNTLSFLAFELGRRNDVQQRLIDEVKAVPGPLEYDQTRKLEYVNRCINESLRLYPPASNLTRETSSDFVLPSNPNVIIPKGVQITVFIFGMHRDPRYWDKAEEFIPDRWAEPLKVPGSFAPFSVGSRICIGRNFALAEIATLLHGIFSKYRFELKDNVERNGEIDGRTGLLRPWKVVGYIRKQD
ncbi:cytochrome P450 [Umbelopsis sp. PMI_123]|nr:cytochrome P450 [Umbelopsis sp. PMI_123]